MFSEIKVKNTSPSRVEIDLEGVVGDRDKDGKTTYERFKEALAKVAQQRPATVVVNIRSTGGDVNDALLVYDLLKSLDARIITRCYGYVASAATIIAQAASKGCRQMSSNSLYLIHRAMSAGEGNVNDLEQMVDLLGKTDHQIASIYAHRSGKPIENFVTLMNENSGNGKWLAPSEAMDEGLVDKIIDSKPISNSAAEQIRKLGLPQIPDLKEKKSTMNITKHWNAILDTLGLANQEQPLSDEQLATIDSELNVRSEKIVDLQNKIVTLETENVRLNALATTTKFKEDPSHAEYAKSANEMAYSADIVNFK